MTVSAQSTIGCGDVILAVLKDGRGHWMRCGPIPETGGAVGLCPKCAKDTAERLAAYESAIEAARDAELLEE